MKPIGRGLNVSVSYSIRRLNSFKSYGTPSKVSKYPDDVIMFIVFKYYRGEKTMKLNLLFIVMDLLTLLAYPVVYVHGKLCQFSKSKESITLAN